MPGWSAACTASYAVVYGRRLAGACTWYEPAAAGAGGTGAAEGVAEEEDGDGVGGGGGDGGGSEGG
eukprot:scaffold113082_cov36-Phaeocystis_antarctica.AAC.1